MSIDVDRAESLSAVLHARHRAAVAAGRPRDSLAVAEELAELAAAAARAEDAAWASLWSLDGYCRIGDRRALDAEMATFSRVTQQLDSPLWQGRLAAARATVALLDGRSEEAPGRAAAQNRATQTPAAQTGAAQTDLVAEAWRALELLSHGRTDDALILWRDLAPRLPELPHDSADWLVATAGFATLCTAANDTASARYLSENLAPFAEQHVTAGILTAYQGPVALALGALAVTLGDREGARAHFATALRLSLEMHAPRFAARAQLALDELAGRVGTLTDRENDVALLVADGLTDRQIATRLYISERAVEIHVGHILRKLDTPGRAGITARLAGG